MACPPTPLPHRAFRFNPNPCLAFSPRRTTNCTTVWLVSLLYVRRPGLHRAFHAHLPVDVASAEVVARHLAVPSTSIIRVSSNGTTTADAFFANFGPPQLLPGSLVQRTTP